MGKLAMGMPPKRSTIGVPVDERRALRVSEGSPWDAHGASSGARKNPGDLLQL
jgi:hypothetical protein